MLWLGLAISAAWVPGWTGVTVQTSWVVLSLFLPALALWRPVTVTGFHWALSAWAAMAVAYIPFAFAPADAVWGAWQVVLFALAFWYGSSHDSLRDLFLGLGLGATASALVVFAQALGYTPVMAWTANPPGLYYNSMYAGEIFSLIILGLFIYRLYWLIPILAVALFLTHSNAGWIGLFIGLLAYHFRSLFLARLRAADRCCCLSPSTSAPTTLSAFKSGTQLPPTSLGSATDPALYSPFGTHKTAP